MNKILTRGVVVAVSLAFHTAAWADVIWVDNKLDDYTEHDGTTPALAYRTIQEAVAEAKDNDEVRVRRGTYGSDQGAVTLTSGALTRVFISNKKINLFAEEAADPSLTVIEGAYASEQSPIGNGAARCVTVNAAGGTVIKGFTFSKGASKTSDNTATGKGGGFFLESGDTVDIVDCVIRGCSAGRGAAAFGGTFVRTLITQNVGPESNLRACALYNCVVTRNSGLYACDYTGAIVGCTIYGNNISTRVFNVISSTVYNTYIAANEASSITTSTSIGQIHETCVTATKNASDAAKVKLLKSPMIGDYRPLANTVMTTTADSTYLANVPEAYRATDFYGKPRLPEGDALSVGAVQESVVTAGARVDFSSACSVNGADPVGYSADCADCNYYFCDVFPQALRIKAASEMPVFQYATTANSKQFPDMDDSVVVIPTADGVFSVTPVFATQVLYVSPTGSGEKNGSSAENAFASLQDAVNAAGAKASDYTVIRAAAGDYTTGGSGAVGGQDARVVLSRQVRLVGAGATSSAICGESGSGTGGIGEGAVRCVAFGTANAAVQGFTLKNGHVYANANADNGKGGAVWAADIDTGFVLDCVLRDCVGSRGGAVHGGTYYRCLLTGNTVLSGGNGITWKARFVSSVFTNNVRDPNPNGVLGQSSIAYSCSIDGDAAKGSNRKALNSGAYLYNSVMINGGVPADNIGGVSASVLWDFTTYPQGTDLTTDKDPLLLDSATGDFRPFPGSPVFDAGRTTVLDYFKYASSDFEGQLPTFSSDGYPTAGAFQEPLNVVVITGNHLERLVITGGKEGTNVIERGAQISVSVLPEYVNIFGGFVVDGVEHPKDTVVWTFTAPTKGSAGLMTLEPTFKPGLLVIFK